MSERPDFVPVHRTPVWLSQSDVEAAIKDVINRRGGTAKAVGWDVLAAITELARTQGTLTR